MKNILFLNIWEGLGFMMNKKLEAEEIEMEYLNSRDNLDMFEKYEIKTTPVLVIEGEEGYTKLTSTEEIVEYLKNEQNTEI